jgi:signal transduction histidine kinase
MRKYSNRRILLSNAQVFLVVTIILLLIALGSVVVLAYININTASAFQAGYVVTDLANLQRQVIELHMETNLILRDRSRNFELVETKRNSLDRHLQIAEAEAYDNAKLLAALKRIESLLNQYDYEISKLRNNPSESQYRMSTYQFDSILVTLEKQVQSLYGNEELRFFSNIGDALKQQRTSQTLTISIGAILLIFGILFSMSLGRSVSGEFRRAYELLKDEVSERRRAEEELRQQNEYLAALHETTLALMNRLDVSDLLVAIVTRAAQLLGTEDGYIYLINPIKNVLERRVGVGVFSKSIGFGLKEGEDIAGQVWRYGHPMVINAYATWPYRTPTPGVRENTITAAMAAPLKSGARTVGVIGLAHNRESGRSFSDSEVELLEGFAQLASIALDNAQLFSKADQRTTQIEALYQSDQELYKNLDLDEVYQTLVDVAVDILKINKSVLLIWNDSKTHLYPKTARGFRPETLERMIFAPDQGLIGKVAREGQPTVVRDTTSDTHVDWNITYPERIRSFMHVPIIVDDEVFGIFNVSYTEPQAFEDEDLRLVLALAQRGASAIKNAYLYSQAQQAAMLEERQRLARELHDAVTQTLFSAGIIADVLPRLWEKDQDEALRRIYELRDLTRGALAEMRTLLWELRPTALSETPLSELLHQLGEATVGRTRIPVSVSVRELCETPIDVKVAFYRIAQEALNNIAKHAEAKHVTVEMDCTSQGVFLHIQDDGRGFNPYKLLPDNMGIKIMRERAQAVNASLSLDSNPGEGTVIHVTWAASHG